MEEGVEEEVSDAFPQGGRLDQGGRPDGGAGAGGAEVQHDVLFPECEVLNVGQYSDPTFDPF